MRLDCNKTKAFVKAAMIKAGLCEERAAFFADNLVSADMRGMSSHGVTRLKTYYQRCTMGLVDAKAEPVILSDRPSAITVDGNNALGSVSASFAMKECIERAKKTGVCIAAVKNGNHFGIGASYTHMAAKEGMIGFAMSNGPVAITAPGGINPVLGTSPLAVCIPAKNCEPLDLDMATSTVARGKIALAKKEGKAIPPDWGIDAEGKYTTDPNMVKHLLPFGGHKGFAICLIVEILCSCLSGAKNAMNVGSLYDFSGTQQELGFCVGAIDVSAFVDPEVFAESVDALVMAIKSKPTAEGVSQVFMPGEIEHNKEACAVTDGYEIGAAVEAELKWVADDCGVAFNCEV